MSLPCKILFLFALTLICTLGRADPISVEALNYPFVSQKARLAFTVTASPKHRVFVLDNPPRLVIDIKNASLKSSPIQPPASHPLFAKVRSAARDSNEIRFVVDLKKSVKPDTFYLTTNNKTAERLLIDLVAKQPVKNAVNHPIKPNLTTASKKIDPKNTQAADISKSYTVTPNSKGKQFIVAVDAGHGGDDPGAHGPHGTEEKEVTFAIAKKLAALINAQPNMKAVMIRKGDYYIGLRQRMHLARKAKADVFISIHADAFHDASVRGASVYTLSTHGASSEAARWIANNENASEVGGVKLSDKEDVLATVLLDLSQTATQQASNDFASNVLKNFQDISVLHKDSVQQAGFIVLKSPDIPSILVETAYISNPLEEQNLTSPSYQTKIANAIFSGVRDYFKKPPTPESRIASL